MQATNTTWDTCIYALYDPRTKTPRYVGQTSMPKERFTTHMRDKGGKAKKLWLDELASEGLSPEFIILEYAMWADCDQRERYWAQKFVGEGHALTNAMNTYPMLDLAERTISSGFAWNTRRERMLQHIMALIQEQGVSLPLSPQGAVSRSAVLEYALTIAIEVLAREGVQDEQS